MGAFGFICACVVHPANGQTATPRQVTFPAKDGFQLHAGYYSDQSRSPAVLLVHQCDREATTETGYRSLAAVLSDRGYTVMDMDLRSYGKSINADFPPGAWRAAHGHLAGDVGAALDFLSRQRDVIASRIAIVGASCGGDAAVQAAVAHPEVRALVLLSSVVGDGIVDSLRNVRPIPIFCIASRDDPIESVVRSMQHVFQSSEHAASRITLVRGPYHGTFVLEHDANLERAVVDWLDPIVGGLAVPGTFEFRGEVSSPGDGLSSRGATLLFPVDVAVDGRGNIFVVEREASRIRRVDAETGVITTVVGTGQPAKSSDGGTGPDTALNAPNSLVFNPRGDMIFCDTFSRRVRRVDSVTGRVSTVVGTGEKGQPLDGAPPTKTPLAGPYGLCFDLDGHLIVLDTDGNQILRVDSSEVRIIAGSGDRGYNGDAKPPLQTQFSRPHNVLVDSSGDIIVGDSFNHRIRKLSGNPYTVTTIAGTGAEGMSRPGDNAAQANFRYFGDIIVDFNGQLVISEWGNERIVRIDDSGRIRLVAGTGSTGIGKEGVDARESFISGPAGMSLDRAGNLLFVESDVTEDGGRHYGRLRKIDASTGKITTIAGHLPDTNP